MVPVYNTAEYLSECLQSIIMQNIHREIIAVDDGSTDSSGNILAEFAAKFDFIRIITQPNKGVSAARNAGLRAAKGRYVYFVDSDDYLLPNRHFRDYLAAMQQYRAVILKGCSKWEHLNDEFTLPSMPEIRETALAVYSHLQTEQHGIQAVSAAEYLPYLIQKGFSPDLWAHIFDTAYLRRHKLTFDESLSHAEDTLFVIQALTCEPITLIESSEILYYYRERPNSAVHQADTTAAFHSCLRAINALWQYLRQNRFDTQTHLHIVMVASRILEFAMGQFLNCKPSAKTALSKAITPDLFALYQMSAALEYRIHGHASADFHKIGEVFRQCLQSAGQPSKHMENSGLRL
ncbi:glycosyltransferase family 2 protein [Neisseria animalis]|uniref:glycosyltransferase family 2 protein n=1 Tax=Neisseria animalis TaxID=492 RepID=UPI0039E6B8AE